MIPPSPSFRFPGAMVGDRCLGHLQLVGVDTATNLRYMGAGGWRKSYDISQRWKRMKSAEGDESEREVFKKSSKDETGKDGLNETG